MVLVFKTLSSATAFNAFVFRFRFTSGLGDMQPILIMVSYSDIILSIAVLVSLSKMGGCGYLTILGDLKNTFFERKNKTSMVPLFQYQKGWLMHHQPPSPFEIILLQLTKEQFALLISLICSFHICLFWNPWCSLMFSEKFCRWRFISCI